MTLPPGQIETNRFPLVGERKPSADLADGWRLAIGGLVAEPIEMSLTEYMAMQHGELVFDIHCVTSWTRRGGRWQGLPISEILAMAKPLIGARYVSFTAYSDRDHHTSLPLEVVQARSWLAHAFDGEPLATEHGGPVRVVTPGKYFYKSIKWVRSIELLAEDRLGWWETNSSYHNNADPWAGDQRFTSGSIRPEQLNRFRHAEGYDKYRGRVLLGLDLRRWAPADRDLRRLYLKNCDLRDADLRDADLRSSNLSLSDLRGALLRGADLSGSDLEGADFGGADLTGADLSGSALSATRFRGAVVDGTRFDEAWGLLESEQDYLVKAGVAI